MSERGAGSALPDDMPDLPSTLDQGWEPIKDAAAGGTQIEPQSGPAASAVDRMFTRPTDGTLSTAPRDLPAAPPEDDWKPVVPVPADAPRPPFLANGGGESVPTYTGRPSAIYVYVDELGRLLGYVLRYEQPGGRKRLLPLTYCEGPAGRSEWRAKGFPTPRPLYGLAALALRPDDPVLIVEGEKAADAAARLFRGFVVVTSPNGAKAASKADWHALRGRSVVIWPDNDAEGLRYASQVGKLVGVAGAAHVAAVTLPGELPAKWDLGDSLPEGWTVDRLKGLLDTAGDLTCLGLSLDPGLAVRYPFRLTETGVEYCLETDDGEQHWVPVCSPLEMVAYTRNDHGQDWGRLVRVIDADGNAHEWAMPMSLLAGEGQGYRERLLAMGLIIAPGPKSKARLHEYITSSQPQTRARCVSRIGWHENSFVLPDRTIGKGREHIVLQTESLPEHAMCQAGDLVDWKREIAQYAVGNSRLAFALSVAFAPPLLKLVYGESGGFHFRGPSSVGKSTALFVAGSVWGGGGLQGYLRTWRATGNGIEAVAQAHNDALLCLDELGEIDGKEAGQVAYMLGNGEGKSRARKDGSSRPAAKWGLLFLSSGELSLADKMKEAGRAVQAGQEARFVDVPANAGAGLGLFETLYHFSSADAFARHLRAASSRYYGTASRQYLERLIGRLQGLPEALREHMQGFVADMCPAHADGQVRRVAHRFGLIAAAGWLACDLGILPWLDESAYEAARIVFTAWLDSRGGAGSAEAMRAIRQLRSFIEQHGESRFTRWDAAQVDRPTINRVGFRREHDGQNEFLFFPCALRDEVFADVDFNAALRVFREEGILIPDGAGRSSWSLRAPGLGHSIRLYRINAKILVGGGE